MRKNVFKYILSPLKILIWKNINRTLILCCINAKLPLLNSSGSLSCFQKIDNCSKCSSFKMCEIIRNWWSWSSTDYPIYCPDIQFFPFPSLPFRPIKPGNWRLLWEKSKTKKKWTMWQMKKRRNMWWRKSWIGGLLKEKLNICWSGKVSLSKFLWVVCPCHDSISVYSWHICNKPKISGQEFYFEYKYSNSTLSSLLWVEIRKMCCIFYWCWCSVSTPSKPECKI